MGLPQSLARAGASSVRLLRQRLALAALDLEEEVLRLGGLLAAALLAVMLTALALAALAGLVIVLFWDTARIAALVGVTLAFALGAGLAGAWVWRSLRSKPAFMSATLDELARDGERLSGLAS